MDRLRCFALLFILAPSQLEVSSAAPVDDHTGSHEKEGDFEGYPMLFTVMSKLRPAESGETVWPQESAFQRTVYSTAHARDVTFALFKRTVGTLWAESINKQLNVDFEAIKQKAPKVKKVFSKMAAQGSFDDVSVPEAIRTIVAEIQQLRSEIQALVKVNQVLATIEENLEYIELLLVHSNAHSEDDVDDIIKDIEKFIKKAEKEIEQYWKDLEKMLKNLEKFLKDMDVDDLEYWIKVLHMLIMEVVITDDGTIIIGDEEFERGDLIIMCCPWG